MSLVKSVIYQHRLTPSYYIWQFNLVAVDLSKAAAYSYFKAKMETIGNTALNVFEAKKSLNPNSRMRWAALLRLPHQSHLVFSR